MDIHKNARLTLIRREQLAQAVLIQKMSLQGAARSFHVCARTAAKWTHRYQKEGLAGLHDRSSRPHRSPRRTGEALAERVEQLRRQRFTGYHIAQTTGLSRATVSRILRRLGLNRMRDLEPAVPLIRYEHPAPGDLLHLDLKQLGRFSDVVTRLDGRRRGNTIPAGNVSTSPSTTIPAWLSVRSAPMAPPLPPSLSSTPVSLITPAWGFAFAACLPITVTAIAPMPFAMPSSPWACVTASPAPTLHAPTVKPNALFKLLSENGSTLALI